MAIPSQDRSATIGFIAVYTHFADGTRSCLFVRRADFDVDAWAQSRQQAFRILGVTKITVEKLRSDTDVR